jgi:hypothetical protein
LQTPQRHWIEEITFSMQKPSKPKTGLTQRRGENQKATLSTDC